MPERGQLIGREAELEALGTLLDGVREGSAALVLDGEAGAGKTALWLEALSLARERGYRVLEARPAEAEAKLAFAGIGDLLAGVLDETLDALPGPQADALRVALLRERPGRAPPDERAVGMGVLGVLRELAAAGPVLIAVDDVQWLDPPSAVVLGFAWRRLHSESCALLATQRLGVPAPAMPAGAPRLEVGPLRLGAIHRLLQTRLGVVLSRPVLRRVHEVAGGNPLFALELGRALALSEASPATGEPLPVPERLRELVRGRLVALPRPTREALAAVAALSQPTHALLARAGAGADELRPAIDAQVLVAGRDRVRFSHPLLASTAYEDADPLARRLLHRRLAGIVGDPEEAARHLALAAEGPDEEVASALEAAAAHAGGRGASAAAADLCDRAWRLTPAEHAETLHRRMVAAGRLRFRVGDMAGATELVERAVATAPDGARRAEALAALWRLRLWEGDQAGAEEVAAAALAEPEASVLVRADAAHGQGCALMFMRERLDEAERLMAESAEDARSGGDAGLLANSIGQLGVIRTLLGRPDALFDLEIADWRKVAWDGPAVAHPHFHRGIAQTWRDAPEEAAALFRDSYAEAIARGDDSMLPITLAELAVAEHQAGRWPEALRAASEGHELAVQTGQRHQQAMAVAWRALAHAGLGREAEARADAGTALAIAGERGMAVARIGTACALASLELSLGRPEAVAAHVAALRERLVAGGVAEPGSMPFVADEVEALIALGDVEQAARVLGWLEERGRALDRASALAGAARCRGLLLATSGDHDGAAAAFEEALAQHDRVRMPFERARTLLAMGAWQRRAKQKAAARATLTSALAAFEALGAALWAERARAELARIGGRAAPDGRLTPAELRVAELVVDGRSNKEIAAALFVTPKTVETQLSRIYGKLGIHTRTALAQRVRAGEL
jgi:DNA-binding CsgD family transcriptional regulator